MTYTKFLLTSNRAKECVSRVTLLAELHCIALFPQVGWPSRSLQHGFWCKTGRGIHFYIDLIFWVFQDIPRNIVCNLIDIIALFLISTCPFVSCLCTICLFVWQCIVYKSKTWSILSVCVHVCNVCICFSYIVFKYIYIAKMATDILTFHGQPMYLKSF